MRDKPWVGRVVGNAAQCSQTRVAECDTGANHSKAEARMLLGVFQPNDEALQGDVQQI